MHAISPPAGWPRLSSALFYEDAQAAIVWLQAAFGFELQLKVDGPDGSVLHSQLVFGDALIMVGEGGSQRAPKFGSVPCRSPQLLGRANTQSLMLYVDDVDAHCARARNAGATIVAEPTVQDYGPEYWADRGYGATDLEGHFWWFAQRLRSAPSAVA